MSLWQNIKVFVAMQHVIVGLPQTLHNVNVQRCPLTFRHEGHNYITVSQVVGAVHEHVIDIRASIELRLEACAALVAVRILMMRGGMYLLCVEV